MSVFFPVFIPLEGEPVLIAGGGKIALRRAEVLSRFGANLTVIAPEILPEFAPIARCIFRTVEPGDITSDYRLVIAATSDRAANRMVGERAKALSLPVSVADAKEESTFYFPAVMEGGGVVAGLISREGGNHKLAARRAAEIRALLEKDC